MGGNAKFAKKKRIWMDMDLAERDGVEWGLKTLRVKGSNRDPN